MKICFPTEKLQELDSTVNDHFGSAPGFVIVDTDSDTIEEIKNGDEHHAHGMCQPLKALGGRRVDAIAVGGIGMGALMKLQAQGIRVFRAVEGTVGQNVQFAREKVLPEFDPRFTCAGYAGSGCAH
ncbi:MAG TPA: diguanylate cyclase [Nitrospiraceae bacterium]|jgi:predicted Fe-Mo cluster-binding NifX family protein|nr:diguanylate cyclase [Nitrospiraceae bacterium]